MVNHFEAIGAEVVFLVVAVVKKLKYRSILVGEDLLGLDLIPFSLALHLLI